MSEDINILKQLIKEVKEEMNDKILKENKEPKVKKENMNEYIIKNVLQTIRNS